MTIKLFLPEEIFYSKTSCDIYGEIKIEDENCISYYIVSNLGITKPTELEEISYYERDLLFSYKLRHLGHIVNATDTIALTQRDVALVFNYDNITPNIYLSKLSIKPNQSEKVNIFLYNEEFILKLQDLNEKLYEKNNAAKLETENVHHDDDIHLLHQLLQKKASFRLGSTNADVDDAFKRFIGYIIKFPFIFFITVLGVIMTRPPFVLFSKYTVIHEYYKEWLKFRKCGTHECLPIKLSSCWIDYCSIGNIFIPIPVQIVSSTLFNRVLTHLFSKRNFNIAFDIIVGLCANILLISYIENPGDYIIAASDSVVKNFRSLLQSLQGSPIGLKLNVQLSKFLLDCFGYHVELWATFLNIIEPCIRQLLIPVILLGFIGFSYQLALLTDLISVMGLHAHCFSIYAAVLYKGEIKGLQVLWKVVLGKRRNVLKNRVETHNYKNRQLYLATVFFTSLLFLFPTVLTYYVVFTSLRLCITLCNYVLKYIRRYILEFPMEMLFRWIKGDFYDTEFLQLEFIHHKPSPFLQEDTEIQMCVFKLSAHSTSFGRIFSCQSGILQELAAKEENSIKIVFQRILKGTF